MTEARPLAASFRDPSGRVYLRGADLLRAVAPSYVEHYKTLMSSGLYDALVKKGQLVAHDEVADDELMSAGAAVVIRPQVIPFISYPFEWSFSQLKDAALLTLAIAEKALEHGMVLKDASAYNVQFVGSRPVFIDTLSFERYEEGAPWVAYRQFCEHFLAPLALMATTDVRAGMLMRDDVDGVPLTLAASLLPAKTRLKPGLLMHIHLHARAQGRYSDDGERGKRVTVSKFAVTGLIQSLAGAVRSLDWRPEGTEWGAYYQQTNYSEDSMDAKTTTIERLIHQVAPATVWDMGANTGRFSRLAVEAGAYTLAWDIDHAAVDIAYRSARERGDERILPLRMDLMNPSPSLGWRLTERPSFLERGRPDLVLALALVHHIAVSHNVPLTQVAEFFAGIARRLLIEFVPKEDSQVRRLLASRPDIFPDYHQEGFEAAFGQSFRIVESVPVEGSERTLYLMEATNGG